MSGTTNFRAAYLALDNDDARRGFMEMHMAAAEGLPGGAWIGFMEEALGDDWVEELDRLGLWDKGLAP